MDSVYETNMDDAVQQPEKKNCTFLFKRRKIRNNATRKRKEADGNDGNKYRFERELLIDLAFQLDKFGRAKVIGYVRV